MGSSSFLLLEDWGVLPCEVVVEEDPLSFLSLNFSRSSESLWDFEDGFFFSSPPSDEVVEEEREEVKGVNRGKARVGDGDSVSGLGLMGEKREE